MNETEVKKERHRPQNQWEQLAWQGILKLLRHTEQQSSAKGSAISLSLSLSLTHSRWAFFKTIYLWDKFWIAPDQKWNSRLRVPWVRFLIFILNFKKIIIIRKKEVVFLLHVFALKIKIMLIFYLTNYHISLYWMWILKI